MRKPDFALSEAIGWFLSDRAFEVQPSTLATYRSWLTVFARQHTVLADLTPENAERFIRASRGRHTAMNKAIALKSFAKYLAAKKLWYDAGGPAEGERLSVLRDVKQPRPLPNGQPAYNDAEVRAIMRAVNDGPSAGRNLAVVMVELHGLRGKEARCLQLRNVILPAYREHGHLVIEAEGTKSASGMRTVPLEPLAVEPIRDYIRLHRPPFRGSGMAPLFLTDAGHAFSAPGWNAMAQRLRRLVANDGIPFRQHRLRSTSVRLSHEHGWPDSGIIAAHGWSPVTGQQMLARYRGPIPVEQLKRYPARLQSVIGRSA